MPRAATSTRSGRHSGSNARNRPRPRISRKQQTLTQIDFVIRPPEIDEDLDLRFEAEDEVRPKIREKKRKTLAAEDDSTLTQIDFVHRTPLTDHDDDDDCVPEQTESQKQESLPILPPYRGRVQQHTTRREATRTKRRRLNSTFPADTDTNSRTATMNESNLNFEPESPHPAQSQREIASSQTPPDSPASEIQFTYRMISRSPLRDVPTARLNQRKSRDLESEDPSPRPKVKFESSQDHDRNVDGVSGDHEQVSEFSTAPPLTKKVIKSEIPDSEDSEDDDERDEDFEINNDRREPYQYGEETQNIIINLGLSSQELRLQKESFPSLSKDHHDDNNDFDNGDETRLAYSSVDASPNVIQSPSCQEPQSTPPSSIFYRKSTSPYGGMDDNVLERADTRSPTPFSGNKLEETRGEAQGRSRYGTTDGALQSDSQEISAQLNSDILQFSYPQGAPTNENQRISLEPCLPVIDKENRNSKEVHFAGPTLSQATTADLIESSPRYITPRKTHSVPQTQQLPSSSRSYNQLEEEYDPVASEDVRSSQLKEWTMSQLLPESMLDESLPPPPPFSQWPVDGA